MECKNLTNLDFGKTISNLIKRIRKKEDEVMQSFGLTHFHSKYIMNIHRYKSLKMADLTELAGVDKANTTRVVKDLLKEDIVIKSGGERKYNLTLTEKGKQIAETFKKKIENFFKKVFKDFSKQEIVTLKTLLDKMFLGVVSVVEGVKC